MNECELCRKDTGSVFNINLKMMFVCDSCANSIVMQQVRDLIRKQEETE
jgi:ribosome-binding protein aMBF1 (putative translation factor)